MTSFVVAIISPVLPKFILWIFIGSLFVFSVCVTMSSLLLAHSQEEEYSKLPICKKIKRPYGIFKDLKKCSGKSSIPLAFSIIKSSIYLVFRIISTFVCQVMLFVFVFLMFLKFRGSSYDGWVLFLVAVFFLFGVAISIVIYSISWIGAIKVIISSGFLLTFISFVVMDSIGAPSIFAVNRLGIGELNAARLVLSGKGCKQLNLALGGKHCEEVADDQPTSLCPVTLRSRIGTQVLIEVAPVTLTVDEKDPSKKTLRWHDKENPRQRVVLDKSVLLAWSRLPGFPFSTEGGPYCKENPQDCEKPASSIAYGANKSNSFTLLQKELLARCGMP